MYNRGVWTAEDEKYWKIFEISTQNVSQKDLILGKIYALKIENFFGAKDYEILGIYTGSFTGKKYELFDFWKSDTGYIYSDKSPVLNGNENYDIVKGEEGIWLEFETIYHPKKVDDCLIRLPALSKEIYLIPENAYDFASYIFWKWRNDDRDA